MSNVNYIYHEPIGPSLFLSVAEDLAAGHLVALIGPRYVGKRFTLAQVVHALMGREPGPLTRDDLILTAFLEPSPPPAAAGEDDPGPSPPRSRRDPYLSGFGEVLGHPEEALMALRKARDADPARPKVLLAANVDAIPRKGAEKFLADAAALAEEGPGKVGVLVTTEAHGPELFEQAGAPRPDRVYVLQRFDEAEFAAFADKYLDLLGLDPEGGREELVKALYGRTGGRIYFLRCLLWSLFDRWGSDEGHEQPRLCREAIDSPMALSYIPWNHFLRYMTRLISRQEKLWPELVELRARGRIAVTSASPSLLELAGIATREGDWLETSGGLIREFLSQYYTPLRQAELYSLAGKWDEALGILRRVREQDPARLVRPASIDDVVETEHAVRRLGASLFRYCSDEVLAEQGTRPIRDRFADGCRLLLGYQEVTFWVRDYPEQPWRRLMSPRRPSDQAPALYDPEGDDPAGPDEFYQQILGRLPAPGPDAIARVVLLEGFAGAAARIEARHPDQDAAVIVRALPWPGMPPNSRAREESLEILFEDFLRAHCQAKRIARRRWKSEIRHQLSKIAVDVLTLLGSEVQRLDETLDIVARRLRAAPFSYKRVVISLIDPEESQIVGTCEASNDPRKTLLQYTRYPLGDPGGSFHARAIKERHWMRSADILKEGGNAETIAATGANAGAVIPLLFSKFEPESDPDPKPIPLGTLWCERADSLAPSEDEVDELAEFASKLAVVLVQSRRVQLLQSALDRQRQPILILDGRDRPVFANRAAAELTGARVVSGWRNFDIDEPNPLAGRAETFVRKLLEAVERTKARRRRLVAHFDLRLHEAAGSEWISLLTDSIPYCPAPAGGGAADACVPYRHWRLGVVAEVQRLRLLYRIFDALKRLHGNAGTSEPAAAADRGEAEFGGRADVIVDEVGTLMTGILGHRHALLYQIDRTAPWAMDLARAYSSEPDRPPSTGDYRRISIRSDQKWLCQERGEPVVLSSDRGRGKDEEYRTEMGLKVHNLHDPALAPFLESVGEAVWIDFPIFAGPTLLGIMILDCPPDYPPEDFEFLKVFARLLASLLEGVQGEDRRHHAARELVKRKARDEQGYLVHNLGKPWVMLMDEVVDFGPRLSDPAQFAPFYERVHRRSRDNKDYYINVSEKLKSGAPLAAQTIDLVTLVIGLLRQNGGEFDWTFERDPVLRRGDAPGGWELVAAWSDPGPQATANPVPSLNVDLDVPEMRVVLEQVLRNAVENFARAGLAGSRRLKVEVRLHELLRWPSPRVQLRIRDNGPGIDEKNLKKVFEAFRSSAPRGGENLGLGLAHAWDVVTAHGGWIRAERDPAGGAAFLINLPRFQLHPDRSG